MIKIKFKGVNLKTEKLEIAKKVIEMILEDQKIPAGASYTSTLDLRDYINNEPSALEEYVTNDLEGDLADYYSTDPGITDMDDIYLGNEKVKAIKEQTIKKRRKRKKKHIQNPWIEGENKHLDALIMYNRPLFEIAKSKLLNKRHTEAAIRTKASKRRAKLKLDI